MSKDRERFTSSGFVNEAMVRNARKLQAGTNMSLRVAILAQAFKNFRPSLIANLQRHAVLQCFLDKLIENKRTTIHSSVLALLPCELTAGDNGVHQSLFGVRDVRMSAYFESTTDNITPLSPYGATNELYAPHLAQQAIGDIEVSLCVDELDRNCTLVTNGQATKPFWGLSPKLRNRYKKWYESFIKRVGSLSKVNGSSALFIPTSETVEENLHTNFPSHHAPRGSLDQFYSQFAAKRGGKIVRRTLRHPVTLKEMKGEMYQMPESFT